MGCVLAVVVHAANLHDNVSGLMALCVAKDVFPTIIARCGDSGYRGAFEADAVEKLGVEVDIKSGPKAKNGEIFLNAGELKGHLRGLEIIEDYRRTMKKSCFCYGFYLFDKYSYPDQENYKVLMTTTS